MRFTTQDDILTIVWDSDHDSNILDNHACDGLEQALIAAADEAVQGVVVTTGKADFSTGDELAAIAPMLGPDVEIERQTQHVERAQRLFTRLENVGKPVVAALRGTAVGVGFELALACLGRVASEGTRLALPQVKAGLMPCAGGTQRLPRLIGLEAALPVLTEGRTLAATKALELGILHAVVPDDQLEATALALVRSGCPCSPPSGRPGFALPGGGVHSRKGTQLFTAANALARAATYGNLPAPHAILSALYEGLPRRIDDALQIEARHAIGLMRNPVTTNLVRATLLTRHTAGPSTDATTGAPQHVAVVGGGMMGAGIAQVSAAAGIRVSLIERDQAAADAAHNRIAARVSRDAERGRMDASEAETITGLVRPTATYDSLDDVELVVEAVFEDRALKAQVTKASEAAVSSTAVFASNTSTLPISGLAEASSRPENFIGLHFFSPVDRMRLVEVIVGEQTSDESLTRALEYVHAIGKSAIVVKDSRGFYTSRVFSTYVMEGLSMLASGVAPALIENAGRLAGMPMPPLALADEVSIGLLHRIRKQTREDLGSDWVARPGDAVIAHMVENEGRSGRSAGAGFYDYSPEKRLWQGLSSVWANTTDQPHVSHLRDRLLAIQAVEALRCLDEGILQNADDADLGALLGWGFAPWTGGPIRYIKTLGPEAFKRMCQHLTDSEGDRFALPKRFEELIHS